MACSPLRRLSRASPPGRAHADQFVLGAADGKFRFVTRAGRIEKTVEAHNGALIGVKWAPDGQYFVAAAVGGQTGELLFGRLQIDSNVIELMSKAEHYNVTNVE